ncbi:restriction endonuclease [Listeria booriae]|uniref:Restriction endonuclease n=1 Tax=Listeria booriae TaxID=1552123 RepID=A0A842D3V6_9LIST|nr:restriction endonuclease [Listeria booriae]MBC2005482.1 restriction endonuclease [Listeria booriae]
MFNPTKKSFTSLSSREFEQYSLDILKEQTAELEDVYFAHDKIMESHDGNYQIDGYIEFTVMDVRYKTLIECKHYKSSITREKVVLLHDKLKSLGAQKGILISTSNFQSGAIQYAEVHGIALIQLTEAATSYELRESFNIITASGRKPFNYGKPYSGVLVTNDEHGISCSYLSRNNTKLSIFLLE